MDKLRSGLQKLYRDRDKYRELADNCDDPDDLEFYEVILNYLDKRIDHVESMLDCEVEDG